MTRPLTSVTGDSGSNGVGLLFNYELQWIFRGLKESDFGIDGQVEPVLGGQPSGRVLAVQIKAGPSWFAEETPACRRQFRPATRHKRLLASLHSDRETAAETSRLATSIPARSRREHRHRCTNRLVR
jgi:hypothetical protein